MSSEKSHVNDLIPDISGDKSSEITQIESLCMKCEQQGITRLLLTRIPYFREVIVSSFNCEKCGNTNNELQPASRIQDDGAKISVKILSQKDLSRHVVRTNTATITIPELEFEIPPGKGSLTTVEGILEKAIEGLSQDQPLRKLQHPELGEKIDAFIEKLEKLKDGSESFTLIVDDISGNSFVENLLAPSDDPNMTAEKYTRTTEQDKKLGIFPPDIEEDSAPDALMQSLKNEVMQIDSQCPSCGADCPSNMKIVDIPHFKEVVIMAMTCDLCGYRNNEVKSGAGISDLGRSIDLHITSVEDLKRDVLKSETSSVNIRELDFETHSGTLGGKFTTVEGLLSDIRDNLKDANPFVFGDSSDDDRKTKLEDFCVKLNEIIDGERWGVHLTLDDPAGNSYVQNLFTPDEDPQLKIVDYRRTHDQNDDLGLNDMNTENYVSNT